LIRVKKEVEGSNALAYSIASGAEKVLKHWLPMEGFISKKLRAASSTVVSS